MKQTPNMKQKNPGTQSTPNTSMTVLFVIAGLIVLFIILFCASRSEKVIPKYDVTIKELTSIGLVVESTEGKLGKGEIKLTCADDLYVEDINGQEIDYAELKASDAIRVSVGMLPISASRDVSRIRKRTASAMAKTATTTETIAVTRISTASPLIWRIVSIRASRATLFLIFERTREEVRTKGISPRYDPVMRI